MTGLQTLRVSERDTAVSSQDPRPTRDDRDCTSHRTEWSEEGGRGGGRSRKPRMQRDRECQDLLTEQVGEVLLRSGYLN